MKMFKCVLINIFHKFQDIKRNKNYSFEKRQPTRLLINAARVDEANEDTFMAMIGWNKVLTDEKKMMESLAYAYSSRAMLLLSSGLYENAKMNVLWAESHIHPDGARLDQLRFKFAEYCARFPGIDETRRPPEFLKLSYEANPKIPFIVDCLKLGQSQDMTHYIISDRSLKVGDVIAIEAPFFNVATSRDNWNYFKEVDSTHQRCYHCFNHNYMNLMPCSGCDLGESSLITSLLLTFN